MTKLAIALLIGLVAGCSSVTPHYDARVGDGPVGTDNRLEEHFAFDPRADRRFRVIRLDDLVERREHRSERVSTRAESALNRLGSNRLALCG